MSLESVFKLSLIVNMIDNLTGPMARVTSSVDNSVGRMQRMNQSFAETTKTGAAMAAAGYQITSAVLSPVEATFDTRRVLGELASLGTEDLKVLEDAAHSFSDTWAGTTKSEFLSAAYSIKSGISSLTDEGVAEYTAIAGLTAKATKATIDEMTSLFATGYGIYKNFYDDLSDIEFAEMFSGGLADSIRMFKTSGSGMAQAIQSLGASATTANVPLEEQLSILGMLQATMSGSEAGTKYRAFLKTAARAGEELGLSFTDANNQLLSMPEILETLRAKYGETLDAVEKLEIQKAFGTDEAVALIDLLYDKTGDLQTNILTLFDSMGQGTQIAQDMATAINETEPEKFLRLQQRIGNIKDEIGTQLLPTVNMLLGKGELLLSAISGWIAENQFLVKTLMVVLLTIGMFLVVAGTAITIVGGMGLVITRTAGMLVGFHNAIKAIPSLLETLQIRAMYAGDALRSGFGRVRSLATSTVTGVRNMTVSLAGMARQATVTAVRAMPGLIASVWSFTAALLANPITWVIIGIVALIAAIVLLRRNWETIAAFMTRFGQNIRAIMAGAIDGARNAITERLHSFRDSGKQLITTFTDGIKSVISAPVDAVKSGLAKVRELLPFSDAHEGPLSDLTFSGRRIFETIAGGMAQTQGIPAEEAEKAFSRMDFSTTDEPTSFNLREFVRERTETRETTTEKENGIVIEKLEINVDISKLKELPLLFRLLKEIEDYANSNGETVPVGEG